MFVAGQTGSTRGLYEAKRFSQANLRVTEDEVEAMIGEFAKDDDNSRKTWSRYVVESLFMNVSATCATAAECMDTAAATANNILYTLF